MPYFESGNQRMADLEAMIDSTSLAVVLGALAVICNEKADHLRMGWGDPHTAARWDKAARKIDGIVGSVGV